MNALSTNQRLFAQSLKVLPGGSTRSTLFVPPSPPYAVEGRGAYVTDADGHQVIDCNNNYTALIHGHGYEPVLAAVSEVAPRGTAFGLPTRYEIDMAEVLASRFPHLPQWRFGNSGTEAVMQAVRIARAATGRDLILRFEGSYHGTSDTVVDVSAPGIPTTVADSVIRIPVGDTSAFETAMTTHGDRVAAVLVDLMPNRAGLEPLRPDFVERLRSSTREHGALLVVDEVITFRIAHGGMQRHYGLEADLTTLGKVIGGGFPVGAVGGRAEVMAVVDPRRSAPVSWGGTFSANPVTMAAGLAALANYGQDESDALNRRGETLRAALSERGLRHSGMGSLTRVFPHDLDEAWWRAYQGGVLLGTNGLIALSTAMTDSDIEQIADVVTAAVAPRR